MDINIYLLCYNEELIIQHTINHYKIRLPNCNITIYDNMSSDNSELIAKKNNCNVVKFNTKGEDNELIKRRIINKCWKNIKKSWIIVADMDEWLDINMDDLINEYNKGTSILSIQGCDMIGESNSALLDDINLNSINKYFNNSNLSKNICFLREKIINMNYSAGHHKCNPESNKQIIYSNKIYNLKHMNFLGLPYITNKIINRYKRNQLMQKIKLNVHYTDDVNKITEQYKKLLSISKIYLENNVY
jgi:hypothetical protein